MTSAGARTAFDGVATGDLVRHVVVVQPFLVEEVGDVGAMSSQARVTSASESSGFASSPYPGPLLLTVPGLAIGQVGLPFQAPEYPLMASSSYPVKSEGEVQAGSISLRSESKELTSKASAADGGNRTEASVAVDNETESVTARAETEVVGADFGPGLSVAGIRSSATVTRSGGGEAERSSSFSVASVTALGQQLRHADGHFELATQRVPTGDGSAAVNELLRQLAEHGLSVRVLEPMETPDGVYSSGLEVTRETEINGTKVTMRSTFGRSFASVTNRALGGSDVPEPAVPGTASPPATGASFGDDLAAAGGPPSAATPADVPDVTHDEAAMPQRPAVSASSIRPELAPGGQFYPVLVAAGACLVAVLDVFRKWGVLITWVR